MLPSQEHLKLSEYSSLYDILVKPEDELRRMNELMDFSFVRKELYDKYCHDNGRTAVDPVCLFKYLLLKAIHPQSDVDLVKRSFTDMSYKYFLGLTPEEEVIDASLLTKFRRQRIKDTNLLDMLISKSVSLAISKGIISRRSPVIVDSTHSLACYNLYSPKDFLQKRARNLLKVCSSFYNENFREEDLRPKGEMKTFEEEMSYCNGLVDTVQSSGMHRLIPGISQALNYLEEAIDDIKYEASLSKDTDARAGYKTKRRSFFGYKNHLAMTPEGIITSAVVTSGEKDDGKELKSLIEKSAENGVEASHIIGDTAYSGKDNIKYCEEEDIKLVSPLNPTISNGTRKDSDMFDYNKDAGMFVCPAGHLSVRKKKVKSSGNRNLKETYYFDIKKCEQCPLREGCYKKGAKQKSYSVTILSKEHKDQEEYEKSEEFKILMKKRRKIEAKNSELKNVHGLKKAFSFGIDNMEMQTVMSIFVVNLKRILKKD
jgi:hypothetical protein